MLCCGWLKSLGYSLLNLLKLLDVANNEAECEVRHLARRRIDNTHGNFASFF